MDNQNNTPDQVTLTLDDGSELICDVIAIFPVNINNEEQSYIALLPSNPKPEDEIFLYRFLWHDEDNVELLNIEDDDEFDAVSDAFDELLDEEELNEMLDEAEDEE